MTQPEHWLLDVEHPIMANFTRVDFPMRLPAEWVPMLSSLVAVGYRLVLRADKEHGLFWSFSFEDTSGWHELQRVYLYMCVPDEWLPKLFELLRYVYSAHWVVLDEHPIFDASGYQVLTRTEMPSAWRYMIDALAAAGYRLRLANEKNYMWLFHIGKSLLRRLFPHLLATKAGQRDLHALLAKYYRQLCRDQ